MSLLVFSSSFHVLEDVESLTLGCGVGSSAFALL